MPQNVYCIHIDSKAPADVHRTATAIANCFDNVFIASRLESVRTGLNSVFANSFKILQLLFYTFSILQF